MCRRGTHCPIQLMSKLLVFNTETRAVRPLINIVAGSKTVELFSGALRDTSLPALV